MSRVSEGDFDYSWEAYSWQGRWERNSRAVVMSKRGQKVLREVRDALLALPVKELAHEVFHLTDETEDRTTVQMCVLGAFAAHKGANAPDWLNGDYYNGMLDVPCDAWETARWASANLGMTETLAFLLVELNDDTLATCTPTQRYDRVMAWLDKRIKGASR